MTPRVADSKMSPGEESEACFGKDRSSQSERRTGGPTEEATLHPDGRGSDGGVVNRAPCVSVGAENGVFRGIPSILNPPPPPILTIAFFHMLPSVLKNGRDRAIILSGCLTCATQ